jgi:hypothetical protein
VDWALLASLLVGSIPVIWLGSRAAARVVSDGRAQFSPRGS